MAEATLEEAKLTDIRLREEAKERQQQYEMGQKERERRFELEHQQREHHHAIEMLRLQHQTNQSSESLLRIQLELKKEENKQQQQQGFDAYGSSNNAFDVDMNNGFRTS